MPDTQRPASLFATRLRQLLAAALACTLLSCGGGGGGGGGTSSSAASSASAQRSFWMGFTSWPWDATTTAVDWTWTRVKAEGDLISHHIDEGVPWPQAATGVNATYPTSFQGLIDTHRTQAAGKRHLVSLNPLSIGRDGMALLRTEQTNQPLTAPWNTAALDSTSVKTAYTNYVLRMINELSPDVLLTGIEVNLLIEKNPALWPAFVNLQCHVYTEVKKVRPDLPIGVSLFAVGLLPEWSTEYDLAQQQTALAALGSCVDVVAWSVYPYMSALLADSLPSDFFSRFVGRLPASLQGKTMGISESGYPAQTWSASGLTWYGTPTKQRDMLSLMLSEANRLNMRFVAWFTIRDYDQLWNGALAQDPTALVWRDTGLYGEDGAERAGLGVWRDWRARTAAP
ncbi:MAG: hypothetical protein QM776_10000 [Rhodocyclaceae bacterium]